jgi:acetyl-CoA carboxylase biotin carboxyl carrier protein
MASLDLDLVRHALKTAQEHGFAEVEVGIEGATFRARVEAGSRKKAAPQHDVKAAANGASEFKYVKSPIVGFYRLGPNPLEVGKPVKKGEIVAIVNALGIANDVEAAVEGEIVEVLVKDGQAVEFGQVLAKVKG